MIRYLILSSLMFSQYTATSTYEPVNNYSNYFPLSTSNKWIFKDQDDEKAELKVDRKIRHKSADCYVLVFKHGDLSDEYYLEIKPTVGIVTHKYVKQNSKGKFIFDYPSGIMFFPYFLDESQWETPLISNSKKTAYITKYIKKDEFQYRGKIVSSIVIERKISSEGEDSDLITTTFANGIGPLKIAKGSRKYELTDYHVAKTGNVLSDKSEEQVLRSLISHAEKLSDKTLLHVILSVSIDYKDKLFDIDVAGKLKSASKELKELRNFNQNSYESLSGLVKPVDDLLNQKRSDDFRQYCNLLLIKYVGQLSAALNKINSLRLSAGLKPVMFSLAASKACMYHAYYLNGVSYYKLKSVTDFHSESKSNQYYTSEGDEAAAKSVISGDGLPTAVDRWMGTFFHRLPLLNPSSKEIGIGLYSETYSHIKPVVVNMYALIESGQFDAQPVTYPFDGQSGVPINFVGDEIPDPVKGVDETKIGYPITIQFFTEGKITGVKAQLILWQSKVECYLHAPDSPTNPDRPVANTICLMPKEPLKKNSKYKVIIECQIDGFPFKKEWSFNTM